MKRSSLDHFVRRFAPSTAILSRSAVFVALHRIVEIFPRAMIRTFTKAPLPPGRMIVRIGVGNAILRPHYWYLNSSYPAWMYFMSEGMVAFDSVIVDIGSGVGRSAVGLRDLEYHGARFSGHYHGIDVDQEMVTWCQNNFPSDRFSFVHVPATSSVYNPDGEKGALPNLDHLTNTVDFVFSQSLFTHLLEEDLKRYLEASANLLHEGGTMAMTFFCLEDLDELGFLGGRWTFKHRRGAAYIENEKYPEAAVAYHREWMTQACLDAGFASAETGLPDFQTTIFARK